MPNGVVILSGEGVITQFNTDGLAINITKADQYVLDLATGTATKISGRPITTATSFTFDPDQTANLHFTVEADYDNLEAMEMHIATALSELPVNGAEVGISVTEILSNVIKKSLEVGGTHELTVSMLYMPEVDILMIGITDELGRLDVSNISLTFDDPSDDHNQIKPFGRGIGIVAALMKVLALSQSDNGAKEVFFFVPMQSNQN